MKNFISKILICSIFQILTSAGLSITSSLGIQFLYFTPISIFLSILFILQDYNIDQDNKFFCYFIILLICGVILLSVFFGVYFGLFYPVYSLKVIEIQNCRVIGVAPMANQKMYTILNVEFEFQNQSLLGYACKTMSGVENYDYGFSENTISISCKSLGNSYDFEKSRILNEKNNQESNYYSLRIRQLKVRGPCVNKAKSGPSSKYKFSKVRIPSWLCIDQNTKFADFIEPFTCYINFYGDYEKSFQNAKDKTNLKQVSDFALTLFNNPPFIPVGFYCLIIFTYTPGLLIFYPFSIIISDKIFKIMQKGKRIEI